MRRPSSIEPFTPSSTVTLHPLLQAALDNLDVKVEEELTRYRRQRRYPDRTAPQPASRQISRPASRPPLSLPITDTPETALGILDSNIQRSVPRASLYEAPPLAAPPVDAGSAQVRSHHTPPPVKGSEPAKFAATEIQWDGMQPTQIQSDVEVESTHSISSYAEYADLSAYAPNAALQKLMQHSDPESAPSDYLASSEELLRSIAEEDPELRAEREPNALLDTLLTPLGIGSMLLLVMSSTMLGYVVMNPASIGLGSNSSQSASSVASDEPVNPIATDRSIVPSPDLSSEEFVDLDLNTLSTLPKKSVSTPKASPKANAAQKATGSTSTPASSSSRSSSGTSASSSPISAPDPQPHLSTVVIPAAPPVVSIPEPAIAPPAPAPVSVSPEPISAAPPTPDPVEPPVSEPTTTSSAAEPSPASSPSYYVVTDYSGDPSLQQARDIVPDAYVRNLPSAGAKVQFGAFNDEAKAQELQQELQQQGIEAEVYQP